MWRWLGSLVKGSALWCGRNSMAESWIVIPVTWVRSPPVTPKRITEVQLGRGVAVAQRVLIPPVRVRLPAALPDFKPKNLFLYPGAGGIGRRARLKPW